MRNRIVSNADWVGLSNSYQPSETACAIQHDCTTTAQPVTLFGPERYESGYQYPLVVWLHSSGSSEAELENVMPALSMQNYVGCAPRAPLSSQRGRGRFHWGKSSSVQGTAEELVFSAVESAHQHFNLHPTRVFLAGFGSGATMALRIGLRFPEQFAGVVAVCGHFPNERNVLANLHQARALPILWMYGQDSQQCGISHVCEALPIAHTAKLSLDIRQYPCADELLSNMLGDANAWLMKLITNQPAQTAHVAEGNFSRN